MKSTILGALVGLNLILLVAFAGRMWRDNPAVAQGIRPGDYLLIPGEVTGANNDVIYILDTTNHMLSAMSYDDTSHKIVGMAPLDLNRMFEQAAGDAGRKRR